MAQVRGSQGAASLYGDAGSLCRHTPSDSRSHKVLSRVVKGLDERGGDEDLVFGFFKFRLK